MNVKVSVILPSLNVAPYIEECLNSVLGQTLQELEIICVDAGSTDGTAEIIEQFAKRDNRIRVLHSEVKSYGRQVNIGFAKAVGEYAAILETDDWIAAEMYETLYEQAVKYQLDYAAADFDQFYFLENGHRYFSRQYLFGGEQNWYGKVLGNEELAVLRASDYVLWKGIYNRNFIEQNKIRLHESPKAAFQDMGFLQQVKTYAKRVMYLDSSFYRYRQDRECASSHNPEGLNYYQREFIWIEKELKLPEKLNGVHKQYYYFTMSISFLTKYDEILEKLEGNWKDDRLHVPYRWFVNILKPLIESGFLNSVLYEEAFWNELLILIDSQKTHAELIEKKAKEKEKRKNNIVDKIRGRSVIIFGCGIRGKRTLLFCDRYQINVCGFSDNSPSLQGKQFYGYTVFRPEELLEIQETFITITVKNGAEQILNQLIDLGIPTDRIVTEVWDIYKAGNE